MSDIPNYKAPEGFMLFIIGQITKKVAQNIGKDRFDKVSNRYSKLGIHDSDFKIVSLDDLKNMIEVDRDQQLISQKVIVS